MADNNNIHANEAEASKLEDSGAGEAAGTQRQQSTEEPNTAGGREGTFSQTDEENQDPLDTAWSPGSEQPGS